jgi:hypothetical protein
LDDEYEENLCFCKQRPPECEKSCCGDAAAIVTALLWVSSCDINALVAWELKEKTLFCALRLERSIVVDDWVCK